MGSDNGLRSLGDYARRSVNLFTICRCGHSAVLDSAKLNRWYLFHCWNTDMETIGAHLRCSRCDGHPDRFAPTPRQPNNPHWMSDEHQWERLAKRLADRDVTKPMS
ncbi:hypothetical protein SJA_C1-08890 [Sphingobium indicum UT26S]|uniref:Uncharacterized protein n=1 Tax=Sphingobium indicum (strain DSM 16413 / CCM 7287 / MTCC 6362 / UT26 / NBRC 101211 / UT26S) TaxID=452662 RepID=D4YZE1_SPHIU|nr:hypothetical protein SJA_C1-08890 [Sphingobium indicum UT26S]